MPSDPEQFAAGALVPLLVGTLVVALVFTSYGFVLEYVWDGRTVGKFLFGVRVVGPDGEPPSVAAVIVRNLPVLVVPFALPPFSHVPLLVVGLAAILLSEDDQRLFDRVADTYVVAA